MSSKSTTRNYIYNVSYQLLLIITPLITTPYISRVLGADGVGLYSYVASVVAYFVLIATLGTTTFGRREISYNQKDIKKRTEIFWNVTALRLITTAVVLMAYAFFISLQGENTGLYIVCTLTVMSTVLDISWFFQGLEEFGRIAARNITFRVIGIIYIFAVVRSKEDLLLYVLGEVGFTFLCNCSLWLELKKFIEKPVNVKITPFKDIRAVLNLFIPTVAVTVYVVLDKTMIGLFTTESFENGYYEQAMKISKLTLAIVTSMATVLLPKIGSYFANNNEEGIKKTMYQGYRFVWFMGIPICFGLIGISDSFVPWFFGEGFEPVSGLLKITSFLVLAIGINTITGNQYMIPTLRQNQYTASVIIGAVINLCLNIILIPRFYATGAAVASVIAESTIAIVQLIMVRNAISAREILKPLPKYLISGLVMLLVISLLSQYLPATIVGTVGLVAAGVVVYVIMLLVTRDSYLTESVSAILKDR